jgi:regulator of nucleoside diphosphate kinase
MHSNVQTNSRDAPIVIDAEYVDRLRGLALAAMNRDPEVGDRLLQEIERAEVLPSADMPAHIVNVGSEVTFRDNTTGRVQTVTLVLPREADIAERKVSVLTPVGAALIGLARGASIDWETRDGESRELTVLKVRAARPAADGDNRTASPDAGEHKAEAYP